MVLSRFDSLYLRIVAAIQLAVAQKRLLTYEELSAACGPGYLPHNQYIGQALAKLFDHDLAQQAPLRGALVVGVNTGVAGSGFFDYALSKGISLNSERERVQFWLKQVVALGVSSFPLASMKTVQEVM